MMSPESQPMLCIYVMYACYVMPCMHVYNLYGVMLHIHGYAMHHMMHECDVIDDLSMDDIFLWIIGFILSRNFGKWLLKAGFWTRG